ncbi:hypothetical protein [Paenibacillus dendritiformis]|uniref:hypothetical protein n=2 Tax=Paenibacillus dendritiformis TaxID=130049 RepID=UPI000A2F560E|nr:hypothetical protein [Paenibacillus dendritiformis]
MDTQSFCSRCRMCPRLRVWSGWPATRFASIATRRGNTERVEVELPASFTAQQGLNEPRSPSLPGMMKVKRKTLQVVEASELGHPSRSRERNGWLCRLRLPGRRASALRENLGAGAAVNPSAKGRNQVHIAHRTARFGLPWNGTNERSESAWDADLPLSRKCVAIK